MSFNTINLDISSVTAKDCVDMLQRLLQDNSTASKAKLPIHQYLQEDNTSALLVHGKQINNAVFIDLDKDKRTYPAQYFNGERWIAPIIYFSIFLNTFFPTVICHRDFSQVLYFVVSMNSQVQLFHKCIMGFKSGLWGLGRLLVVSHIFCFTIIEANVLLGTLKL